MCSRLRYVLENGNTVELRASNMEQVRNCHGRAVYQRDWLRFDGGAMHFLCSNGSVLPIILEPAPTAVERVPSPF